MPSCDGYQCVKMIRDWEKKNNVPHLQICAVTADANPETRDHCLSDAVGFDEFLSKPLRKNVLRDMIVKICGEGHLEETAQKVKRQKSLSADKNSPQAKNESPAEPTAGTHVLVVDDAPTMRLLLRQFLTGMGCKVSEASCGEEAVEIAKTSFSIADNPEPIELIFCDMRMPPGMNGLDTAKTIKLLPDAANVPIIGMVSVVCVIFVHNEKFVLFFVLFGRATFVCILIVVTKHWMSNGLTFLYCFSLDRG